MEMLYKYLSSEEFSGKISMMVDVFSNLKSGIDSERRAMEKNWKKREKDLEQWTTKHQSGKEVLNVSTDVFDREIILFVRDSSQ